MPCVCARASLYKPHLPPRERAQPSVPPTRGTVGQPALGRRASVPRCADPPLWPLLSAVVNELASHEVLFAVVPRWSLRLSVPSAPPPPLLRSLLATRRLPLLFSCSLLVSCSCSRSTRAHAAWTATDGGRGRWDAHNTHSSANEHTTSQTLRTNAHSHLLSCADPPRCAESLESLAARTTDVYEQLLRREIPNRDAEFNCGRSYLDSDRPDLAEEVFRRCIEAGYKPLDSRFRLAQSLAGQHRHTEAKREIIMVLQDDPEHEEALEWYQEFQEHVNRGTNRTNRDTSSQG